MKALYILIIAFAVGWCFPATAQPYTIPVVFHVLHQGGDENISDAQIIDAMRILNEDFNRGNVDIASVAPAYQNNIADMEITFRLANIDPNGNLTNGIDRIYSSLTYVGGPSARLNEWDRSRYMNIWVVANQRATYSGYPYISGATISSDSSFFACGDLMVFHYYLGSIGTSSYQLGRQLTHEIGHYLCLLHPWGNTINPGVTCMESDSVADTPPTRGSTSCNLALAYCDGSTVENVQNFMEFSYCSRMFTNGQKARVHACLDNYRDSLAMPSNLVATGTDYVTPLPSPPIADFSVNKRLVCLGTPVIFSDDTYNGTPTNRQWTFQNANITTSTDEDPVVTFTALGWQSVTLDVSNAQGSSTKTRSLVYVADAGAQLPVPYYNSFIDTADFAANWIPMNVDDDSTSFMLSGNGAFTNSMAIVLTNFNSNVDGSYDELITPAFDLTNVTAPHDSLSFVYSYAAQEFVPPGPIDSLAVYATSNCGSTWTNIFKKGGDALMNGGYLSSLFIPTNAAYWSQVNVPITNAFKTDHVRFKIRIWGSRISNNFYIDDFTVGRVFNGIEENKLPALSVVPNPFNSTIRINGLQEGNYSIAVFDITGREVKSFASVYAANNHFNLDVSSVTAKGVYVLKVTNGNGQSRALKLIRE
ncbi:MAG TPA: M43 family zinc metalloprotease [Chitinophagales bacterium]|nr:M43 family zinc metalloprotease [Chitinophagales bacterium]